jgi:hypothetical protein
MGLRERYSMRRAFWLNLSPKNERGGPFPQSRVRRDESQFLEFLRTLCAGRGKSSANLRKEFCSCFQWDTEKMRWEGVAESTEVGAAEVFAGDMGVC